MHASDENSIVEGLRSGCADSWQSFYDANCQRVWNLVARWLGGSSAEVADVVQETFMAAARSAAGFDQARGSLANWVLGIARNHVAQHLRRKQRAVVTTVVDGDWQMGRESRPDDILERAELRNLVRIALMQMSDDHALLLSARYLDDLPTDEIARQRNCTASAIRSKLVRAREAFRSAMKTVSQCDLDELTR